MEKSVKLQKSTLAKAKSAPSPELPPITPREQIRCSFCGSFAIEHEGRKFIAGPELSTSICDECVEVCLAIFLAEDNDEWISRIARLMSRAATRKYEQTNQTEIPKKGAKKK